MLLRYLYYCSDFFLNFPFFCRCSLANILRALSRCFCLFSFLVLLLQGFGGVSVLSPASCSRDRNDDHPSIHSAWQYCATAK